MMKHNKIKLPAFPEVLQRIIVMDRAELEKRYPISPDMVGVKTEGKTSTSIPSLFDDPKVYKKGLDEIFNKESGHPERYPISRKTP